MFAFLTGAGLSAAAGLNAYVPLLIVGLVSRFSDQFALPIGFGWMAEWWMLGVMAVLLAVEVVVDKIPVVDHVNDMIQTIIRPVSGATVASASTAAGQWDEAVTGIVTGAVDPVTGAIIGGVIALVVHVVKSILRSMINAGTLGFGGPVASTAEDTGSIGLSLLAIFLPVIVGIVLVVFAVAALWLWRLLRRRKRAKAARVAEAA